MSNRVLEKSDKRVALTPPQGILECRNVSKIFSDGSQEIDVLKKINLSVLSGEMLAILGVSGAGKSTFLHILGGLDEPSSGEVLVAGMPMHTLTTAKKGILRNRYLGFIYQFHHLLAEFNALENVAMPLLIRGNKFHDAQGEASIMLDRVGLSQRKLHRLGELSGGERQRVAIARALVTKPVCVLADEPTGNLDKKTAMQIFDLMMDLNRSLNTSFIVVTHDLSFAERMGRCLVLEQGFLT
jgi:lipoprotein-releasing system ATP-binding protein